MLELSRIELEKVMSGASLGVTRWYPSGCLRKPEETVILGVRSEPGMDAVPVAVAKIRSVRPITMKQHMEDKEMCKSEGWNSPQEWWAQFARMYTRKWTGDEILHRLQLVIEKRVDKVPDPGIAMPMLEKRV